MRRVAVYATTKNLYGQLIASAKSLLKHTRMDAVWFLTEEDGFPEQLPDVVHTMNVSRQKFFPPNGPNYNSHWTYMCLLPLAYPEMFPEEDRVLRLDVDTIVEKDIGSLLDMDLEDNYVAMAEEPIRGKFPFRYFNAGVALMDLDKFRKNGLYLKMIHMANTASLSAMDQDPLNVFCQGEIKKIGPEWNCAPGITEDAADPYIRHYAGYLKPRGWRSFSEYEKAEWIVKGE